MIQTITNMALIVILEFICHCRVCTVAHSVTKSKSEVVYIGNRIGYKIAYELDYVSVPQCCTGYFTEVGNSCNRKYLFLKSPNVLLQVMTMESTFHF